MVESAGALALSRSCISATCPIAQQRRLAWTRTWGVRSDQAGACIQHVHRASALAKYHAPLRVDFYRMRTDDLLPTSPITHRSLFSQLLTFSSDECWRDMFGCRSRILA